MITKFQIALMKILIEHQDYTPLRNEEGNLNLQENINILTKNSTGTNIIVELINGDKFTSDEIKERLLQNKNILLDIKDRGAFYFFEVFIFENEPDNDKVEAITTGQSHGIMDKRHIKGISVDLSKKLSKRYFKLPLSDMGLTKSIGELLVKGIPDNLEIEDINNLALQKVKELELELKVKSPILTYSLITINIIIGILLYLYSTKSGISYNQLLIDYGAKENTLIIGGQYWRFFTPIFLHASLTHLLVNCYSLYAVGVSVEKIFGRFRFLTVYIFAGILGNVASFMFSPNSGIGASGAIFGLLGTLLYFGLEKPKLFTRLFGYNIMVIISINLLFGFSTSGIDNYAHIGGLVGGFLISGVISKSQKSHWYLSRALYLILTLIITISGISYGFNNKQNKILVDINELVKLEKAETWSKVEVKAEQILKLEPRDRNIKATVLWTLSKAEALTGKYSEAIEHGKLLTLINPSNGHYILGILYFDSKEFSLAKTELLEAKKAGAKYEQIDTLLEQIK